MNSSKFLVPLYPMYFRGLFTRLSIFKFPAGIVSVENCLVHHQSLGKIQALMGF